jgi:hypothetical protein
MNGEKKMLNDSNLGDSEKALLSQIRTSLDGATVQSFQKHKSLKRIQMTGGVAVLALLIGVFTMAPLSNPPTLPQAWSAEPQNLDDSIKQSAQSRCLEEISNNASSELGALTNSSVLDYRSGIGFLRLDFAGTYWSCGFSITSQTVSIYPWTSGISGDGLIKTYGEFDPAFALNVIAKSFETGSTQFPEASFITGTSNLKTATVKVIVDGLPEGIATLVDGIYGIWVPAIGEATIQFLSSDGSVLEVLRVKSAM